MQKETEKAEQKNWLKTKITILTIDIIEKSKIPLILQKNQTMKEQNLTNPMISQYTRMKSQNVKEI